MNEQRKVHDGTTAILVPEYFPGADFIAAALRVDRVMLADTFRYSRQTFQNRCRVRTPDGGLWLTVPVVRGQHARSIRDTRVDLSRNPLRRHWKTLAFNYQSAPYFEYYEDDIRGFFEHQFETLGELTVESTRILCRLFGVDASLATMSQSDPDVVGWAGPVFSRYGDGSVVLGRQSPKFEGSREDGPAVGYRQNFPGFVPGLSALDMLFNLGPAGRAMLAGP